MNRILVASLAIGLVATMTSDASAQYLGFGANNYSPNNLYSCGPAGCSPRNIGNGYTSNYNQFSHTPTAACANGRCGNSQYGWVGQNAVTCGPNGCYRTPASNYGFGNTSSAVGTCAGGACSLHNRNRYNHTLPLNNNGYRVPNNYNGVGSNASLYQPSRTNVVQPIGYYDQRSRSNSWNSYSTPTNRFYQRSNLADADDTQLF